MKDKNTLITVCDNCLKASCWQGIFMCDDSDIAGTTQKTIAELESLSREHSDYWLTDDELADRVEYPSRRA